MAGGPGAVKPLNQRLQKGTTRMKPSKPITRAFCVELQQELSIAAARREFFSQEPPRSRFEFLCSSEACRALERKCPQFAADPGGGDLAAPPRGGGPAAGARVRRLGC